MRQITIRFLALITAISFLGACEPQPDPQPQPIEGISAESPRYMTAADGNIYITCYQPRSVLRLDTATLKITGICHLGDFHPEGICALDGKLYISSSNISDDNNNFHFSDKIYVVDMATFSVCDSIAVNLNPAKVMALDNNHIVVNTIGDYPALGGSVYGKTQIISITN